MNENLPNGVPHFVGDDGHGGSRDSVWRPYVISAKGASEPMPGPKFTG
jgi:hypothetical protein